VKARLWTAVGILAALALLALVAIPVVRASDWANTSRGIAAAPAEPGLAPLPETPRRLWAAPGSPPGSGTPVAGGTVVVAGPHRIEGREPGTGATRWYYERRNVTLCDWTIRDGVVFAAYRKAAGCRDLVALNAGTGARLWYRNAELPADVRLSAIPGVLVAADRSGLTTLDTGGGLNRWTYTPSGCTLSTPVLGDQGVAVLSWCAGQPEPQVVLLGAFDGKQKWARPAPGDLPRILAADHEVSVLAVPAVPAVPAHDPVITQYDAGGRQVSALTSPKLSYVDPARAGAVVHSGLLLGWTGSELFAVAQASDRLLWTVGGTGPVGGGQGDAVLPSAVGLVELDLATGRTRRTLPLPSDGPSGAGQPVAIGRTGALVVLAGPGGTVVYG